MTFYQSRHRAKVFRLYDTRTAGPRSPRRPLGLADGPSQSVTQLQEGLQPGSDLAILCHDGDKGEGWKKEVAVGTVIQEAQRGNEDRSQRWGRLERAGLFEPYHARQAQGTSQRQAATGLEVPRTTRQAWRA